MKYHNAIIKKINYVEKVLISVLFINNDITQYNTLH